MCEARDPPAQYFVNFSDWLDPDLEICTRCGGVGCKECRHRVFLLEQLGYEQDDPIARNGENELDESDLEDGEDDEVEEIRRRRRREDESFARRLAMGVAMLAEADDSILDD